MELPDFDTLQSILSTLSAQDVENLTELAESIIGTSADKKESEKTQNGSNDFFSSFDFETVSKIMSLIQKLNSKGESKEIRLITALKPMLSEKRQKKADEAMNILRLMSVLPILETL